MFSIFSICFLNILKAVSGVTMCVSCLVLTRIQDTSTGLVVNGASTEAAKSGALHQILQPYHHPLASTTSRSGCLTHHFVRFNWFQVIEGRLLRPSISSMLRKQIPLWNLIRWKSGFKWTNAEFARRKRHVLCM